MIADLAMQRALDAYHRVGPAGLSPVERTLAALWCFESEVANGGFEHFYRSKHGDLAAYAPAAFGAIGAPALATIAERANAVFGPAGIPADRTARTEALAALPSAERATFDTLEEEYAASDLDLDPLIEAYVTATRGSA